MKITFDCDCGSQSGTALIRGDILMIECNVCGDIDEVAKDGGEV